MKLGHQKQPDLGLLEVELNVNHHDYTYDSRTAQKHMFALLGVDQMSYQKISKYYCSPL